MTESTSEVANGLNAQQKADLTPTQVVERFLECLHLEDLDGAMEMLGVDVEYANTGLPTAHGRERVRGIFKALYNLKGAGFDVHMHAITAEGPIVLTERTDVLKLGKFHVQGWVCGRFDVHDGQIVLWRDRFDQLTFLAGMVRGLFGLAVPRARVKQPSQ
jgi:limonene-1,2-epoxide hydrolase